MATISESNSPLRRARKPNANLRDIDIGLIENHGISKETKRIIRLAEEIRE
jgi:hypothetical protein